MKVKDIMKNDIVSIKVGATLKDVAQTLFKKQISGILVMAGEKLVGFVSEKDIYRLLYPQYNDYYENPELSTDYEDMESRAQAVKDKKVEEFMKTPVITLRPDDAVMRAGAIMLSRKLNRLPVVDEEGKVLGIVSRRDIYHAIFKKELGI
ncbi:MAG: CBS domain-containing protein [Patescibacteria group bacterium]|nr:CBS domain-containing protein [Patescibacteria group bacterium]MDD5490352.1 CBS domain-containing protein [Patescibacteria group bacterium]